MWVKTTIGVLEDLSLRSSASPGELVGSEPSEAAGLEVDHVDETNEWSQFGGV